MALGIFTFVKVIGTFANGTKTVLVTSDSNWLGTQSPILYDSVYNGEVIAYQHATINISIIMI